MMNELEIRTKKQIYEDIEELIKMPLSEASKRINELQDKWVSVESLIKWLDEDRNTLTARVLTIKLKERLGVKSEQTPYKDGRER